MKQVLTTIVTLLTIVGVSNAQNVGINQSSPTNSLHVTPVNLGDNPVRIDGIQAYTIGDTALLVINPATGVVKYMNASELSSTIVNNTVINSITDSLLNNSTYINNFGDSLFLTQNFTDSLVSQFYTYGDTLLYNSTFVNNLRDSIDTDVDSVTLVGTILTIYENGGGVFVDLVSLNDADGDPTNELQTISKTGSNVTLSNGGGTFVDDNTQLTEAQVDAFTNNNGYLTSFTEVDGSITNELQTIALSGANATLSNGGRTISINDADSDPINEIQNLSVGTGGATSSIININGGTGVTIQVAGGLTITETGSTVTISAPPSSSGTPAGFVGAFNLNTCPTGWAPADGTGGMPDLRGEFIRGLDAGRGVDAGRTLASAQAQSMQSHNHSVNPPATNTAAGGNHAHTVDPPNTATNTTGNHTHSVPPYGAVGSPNQHRRPPTIGYYTSASGTTKYATGAAGNHAHVVNIAPFNSSAAGNHVHSVDIAPFNSATTGATETKPRNVALLYCVKL